MNNKSRLTVIIVVIALVIAIICIASLCLIPRIRTVNLTLDAVKLDADRNEIGTVSIHIEGHKLDYLFGPDRLDVYIPPFDDLTSIKPSTTNNVDGIIISSDEKEYLQVVYGGWYVPTDELFFGDLAFNPDLDRWIFCNHTGGDGAYYVACVGGCYTTQELAEYFSSLFF